MIKKKIKGYKVLYNNNTIQIKLSQVNKTEYIEKVSRDYDF